MFILKTYAGVTMDVTIPRNVNRYPDGTLGIGSLSRMYDTILWLYEGDDELFTLMCLKHHTVKRDVHLVMPYIPHARMDRVENGEVFTLKTFCKAINDLDFSSVEVMDPHSHVSEALLDRLFAYTPEDYIEKAINSINRDDLILFFPDEGAMKRYSKMFPGRSFAFGVKERDFTTGKIKSLKVENEHLVRNNSVLIVDDICSKGGTFDRASEKLTELGARNIYLYVTHCEPTIFKGHVLERGLVKKVYTTDSILRESHDNIEIVHSFEKEFVDGTLF